MNHQNRTPDMGATIYLNGGSCNCLWKEMMADKMERPATAAAGRKKDDDCMMQDDFNNWPVGMAYVPMQPWENPFQLAKGLHAGTIFPSLRLPFRGGGC